MKEVTHSIKLKISLAPVVAQELTEKFTAACNLVSEMAFKAAKRKENGIELIKLSYETVRKQFGLGAQISQTVGRVVAGKYQSIKSNKHVCDSPVVFKREWAQFQYQRDWSLNVKKQEVSVWTTHGRLKVNYYQNPKRLEKYLNPENNWKIGGTVLSYDKRGVYLTVAFTKAAPEVVTTGTLGIDLGIRHIASCTDGKEIRFFDEGQYVKQRKQIQNKKSEVQSRKALRNTSGIRRLWKRLSGREARLTKNTMHRVSRNIVRFAQKLGSPTIVFENLAGITKNRISHGWSFYMLQNMTEYKAAELGIGTEYINRAYTSQCCSNCGNVAKESRKGGIYKCVRCGFELNSDLNAARNIRMVHITKKNIVLGQVSQEKGATVNAPDTQKEDSLESLNRASQSVLTVGS